MLIPARAIISFSILLVAAATCAEAITEEEMLRKYREFTQEAASRHTSFRDGCNSQYAEFLQTAWDWYQGNAPQPVPAEPTPVEPVPYNDGEGGTTPVETVPVAIAPVENLPQPIPVEPIDENPHAAGDYFDIPLYGVKCRVRLPESVRRVISTIAPADIARAWQKLSSADLANTIHDCLASRSEYNLCDWAYLMLLDRLGKEFCSDENSATLLTAYLFCQSGYQMRLGIDRQRIVLLFGSRNTIYDKPYFNVAGCRFYPYGTASRKLNICDAAFPGETPLSLRIAGEQKLAGTMSTPRKIQSARYPDVKASAGVPAGLIEFYSEYPAGELDANPLSRWAMYAETPLARRTIDSLYPALKEAAAGSQLDAVNRLLNWVQTGFEYKLDDQVWGHDRAFFAEETLFYPYCDCEDRSILFSRIVRDLLGLDVALVYYPGHLATAVKFTEDTEGDAVIINGQRFIVCDPTYIGAPAGHQMPGLDYAHTQAIVLGQQPPGN